jgi:YkoY family integral membrane protein
MGVFSFMIFDLLAEAEVTSNFASLFTLASLQIVVALIVIEGLLSVDNALAIAALASHLDEKKRKVAMTVGYAGAYGFRILALFLASYIINNYWLMALGAGYLIWLMCDHFAENHNSDEHSNNHREPPSFAKTIALIAFLDLSLSFDNVVAAVAFARTNIYLVYLGVTIGIITLRMVAGYCIKLLARHPWLEHTAFLLVGFVGTLLCVELVWETYVRQELPILGYAVIHAEHVTGEEGEVSHFHIQKPVKFGGIFLILIGHLLYEKYPALKKTFRPVVLVFRSLFAFVARSINLVFGIIIWPIRQLFTSRSSKPT